MQLLYTGVTTANIIQPDATRSLGGYISSTSFYNGVESNLFNALTVSQLKSKESQYRLLALKTTGTVTDLRIWVESESDLIEFKLAFLYPTLDTCQHDIFESVPFGNIQPSQAEFAIYTSSSTALGSFNTDKTIGIWIKQEIKSSAYTSVLASYDCENINEILEDEKQLINFVLKVSYT